MSNFSVETHKAFDLIEEWLEKPDNSIKLIDLDTQKPITWLVKSGRKQVFTASDIAEKYNSILELFNALFNKGYTNIAFQLRAPNGTSTTVVGKAYKLILEKDSMLKKGDDSGAGQSQNPVPSHSNNQSTMSNNQDNNMFGGLGSAASMAGLGIVELIDLRTNNTLYQKLKEEHSELKTDSKETKLKLEGQIEALVIDKRRLESEISTKDKENELALKILAADQKGFGDSEMAKTITSGVSDLAKMMVSNKVGAPVDAGLGAAVLSDAKRELVDYVSSDEVTDEVAQKFMSFVVYHMANTPAFNDELQVLINKHQ